MVVSLEPINTIMPVISFLFVFILMYVLISKTKVLDMTPWSTAFLSLIIASFFIVNVQLVDFVKFNVSWFAAFIVSVILILLLAGLLGEDAAKLLTKGGWMKGFFGALILIVVVIFIYSGSQVFHWAVNWDTAKNLMDKEWFGMALLLVVAAAVSYVLTRTIAKK